MKEKNTITNEYFTRGMIGSISEMIVAINLLEKGFEVFTSFDHTSSCDLIALKNKKLYRIQVKTGHFNKSGVTWAKGKNHKKENYDILAVVIRENNNEVIYDLEVNF